LLTFLLVFASLGGDRRGIFFTWLSFVDFMPITFALELAGSSIPMH
jgi:hypothetical protein